MLLKKMAEQLRTLAFRLTLFYGFIFTLSSFSAFLFFYLAAASVIQDHTDEELLEEPAEFYEMFSQKGTEAIKREVGQEDETEDPKKQFVRVFYGEGKQMASTDMSSWGVFGKDLPKRPAVGKDPELETLSIPGKEYDARVITAKIGPDLFMQAGIVMEWETEILSAFKKMFGAAMIIVLTIAGVVGWFMGKSAMSGVAEVTRTANRIGKGNLDQRVPEKSRGTEIERLAKTFNRMLDRIQKLIREMKEMTDNIAHDLKSPITRIRGHAEVTLTTGGSADEYERMAGGAIEECDYLLDMINTMLDISEIEAGASEPDIMEVDLTELVRDLCELFEPLAETKNIDIRFDAPESLAVFGDSRKLQRMAANLLDNAVKYTPENGNVTVSLYKDEKRQAALRIGDTGIGIPGDNLDHIFQRFYRCDQSRAKTGSGLGLCLVKAIVKAHRGEIAVESETDKGSVFTVMLPISQSSFRMG